MISSKQHHYTKPNILTRNAQVLYKTSLIVVVVVIIVEEVVVVVVVVVVAIVFVDLVVNV